MRHAGSNPIRHSCLTAAVVTATATVLLLWSTTTPFHLRYHHHYRYYLRDTDPLPCTPFSLPPLSHLISPISSLPNLGPAPPIRHMSSSPPR